MHRLYPDEAFMWLTSLIPGPLMGDCKYVGVVFSVAVSVSSRHLCDEFVRQFLCGDGTAPLP